MVVILMMLKVVSHGFLRLKICSLVLVPALSLACSSATVSSTRILSLFKTTFSMTFFDNRLMGL